MWDIQRVNQFGDNDVLKVSGGTTDDIFKLRKESICLTAGVYQFTMHDEKPQGGGFSYPGYYNVSSGGDLIVEGREFYMCNSTTKFALPLTATPSMMPSETASPTFSSSSVPSETPSASPTISPTVTLQPSISPSVSFSPTDTCHWIDIVVVFNLWPEETSWQLQKMNDSGDYILLKAYTGTYDERYKDRTESMCLEGNQMYRFTISDRYGDWSEAQGHYNITSDGNLIVQGEAFGLGEITSFSIPYVPGSATLTNVTQEPTTPSPTYQPQTPSPNTREPSTPFPTEFRLTPFPTEPQGSTTSPQTPYPTYSPETVPVSDSDSSPPVASPDSVSVSVGDTVFVSVLDNDTPTAGKTLTVEGITTDASNGRCGISFDLQEVAYEPNPGFVGVDTCVYEACDGVPACDTATLTVTITSTSESTTTTYSPVTAPLTTTESTPLTTTPITNTKTTACLTQVECKEQLKKGYDNFYTGSYADYGCFAKNNNLFWGVGGTDSQNAIISLNNNKERVWC